MDPAYDPQKVESRWYALWEDAGVFRPEINPGGEPFCIVIPPPNVTGSLHMGHALDQSIQDLIIRRKRMQGYAALWLPGADHAGIATQNVVERELAVEGLTRDDLGREGFIEQVWQWKAMSGGRITEQIRRMGFSTDWTRERFTMDDGLSHAVRTVFVQLYDEGLIYRGNRIINWCPRCRTALSDIEVEHEDSVGELVRIRYPFADGEGGVEVATTRPETMFGDTGVAVHPDDDRYRDLVGRTVVLPLADREIPIVADEAVDSGFGTGAVKVTPAHDPLDFEIGERHGFDPLVAIDEAGMMTELAGSFAGLDRDDARAAVKEALAAAGVLVSVTEHAHSVGHCYRCDTVIEPYLSLQWFVQVAPLVGPALAAVERGEIRFVPKRWENFYRNWMENLRDWTISRQIWWGHRIPAWYCDACDEVIVAMEAPERCGCGSTDLHQDEDVLDTWFSSALFPFSTLGWPEETDDFRTFYPNAALVTGYDIIFFWVARMIKLGLHLTGEKPFPDVVIHGLVRAPDGRKMSKSLNNAVDPLEVAEQQGADALRLALIQAAAAGQDVPYQDEWVEAARRFGNKLWNATRFVIGHIGEGSVAPDGGYPEDPRPEAQWILARLAATVRRVDELLDAYKFSEAYDAAYAFAWSEAFDWYLELAKAPLRDGRDDGTLATLGAVLRDILKLFHPVMPFVTEELWSHLVGEGFIATAAWPTPPVVDEPPGFDMFRDLVVGVRRFRADHGLAPRRELAVGIYDPAGWVTDWWVQQLASIAAVSMEALDAPAEQGHTRIVAGEVQGFISLDGLVDVDAERSRLSKELADLTTVLERSRAKLSNDEFIAKAPEAIIAKERRKVAEMEATVDALTGQIADLG
ncbi:MAG TPA: valine--tRNA ligase [Acidimicrobiia bacterium]|nr:valine--tRNA ligase [Acidimicrobiia bacterium]